MEGFMPFDANLQRKKPGRPVSNVLALGELTNRELREKQMLSLARRFKPAVPKALKVMIGLLSDAGNPAIRLKAAIFVVEFHTEIVKTLYKEKYDSEKGEALQQGHRITIIDGSNIAEFKPVDAPVDALLAATNRALREKQLLTLGRKIKPHVTLAIQTIEALIADPATPAPTKYSASRFMILFSKLLTEGLYKDIYDDEATARMEEKAAPVFSLTLVGQKEFNKED
jgi:hypothetical protein